MSVRKGPQNVRTHPGVIAVSVIPGIYWRVMEGVVKVTLPSILAVYSMQSLAD